MKDRKIADVLTRDNRKIVKALWRELRHAYVALDNVPPDDENECHRTIGRYYGLRRAYSIVTGMDEIAVGGKVTGWYVQSKYYSSGLDATVFGSPARKRRGHDRA